MTTEGGSGLEDRLKFYELDGAALRALGRLKGVVEASLDTALAKFYEKLSQDQRFAPMFSDSAAMDRAKARQKQHWATIVSGEYGPSYVEGVTRVGNTHARVGLEPRWYIGAYAFIIEQLMQGVLAERCSPGRRTWWQG